MFNNHLTKSAKKSDTNETGLKHIATLRYNCILQSSNRSYIIVNCPDSYTSKVNSYLKQTLHETYYTD